MCIKRLYRTTIGYLKFKKLSEVNQPDVRLTGLNEIYCNLCNLLYNKLQYFDKCTISCSNMRYSVMFFYFVNFHQNNRSIGFEHQYLY